MVLRGTPPPDGLRAYLTPPPEKQAKTTRQMRVRAICNNSWESGVARGASVVGLEFQKLLNPLQSLVQRHLKGPASRTRAREAEHMLQPAIDHLQIGPAEDLLAP